jgi:hypothetical protein
MKLDDFEQRLQRQLLREVPVEWREDILRVARDAASSGLAPHPSLLSAIRHQLSTLLRPSWAGLAAAWVVIFVLQFAARDSAPALAKGRAPAPPQVVAALQQQKRLLAELVGQATPAETGAREDFAPRPRSEARHEFLTA